MNDLQEAVEIESQRTPVAEFAGLPVFEKDGKKYIKPLDDQKYLVRFYEDEPPPLEKLNAYIKLITDFEKRFFRNVDRGHEVLASRRINEYIDAKRQSFDNTPEGPKKEIEGHMLSIALLRRAMELSIQHIKIRKDAAKNGSQQDEKLQQKLDHLYEVIMDDFAEAQGFATIRSRYAEEKFQDESGKELPNWRAQYGERDTPTRKLPLLRDRYGRLDIDDAVLGEMRGEPNNIFRATTNKKPENGLALITHFYRNRYSKTAMAMESIDKVMHTISQLDRLNADYPKEELSELARTAKIRLQLQRSDPDFARADDDFRIARNTLQDMLQKESIEQSNTEVPSHLPKDHKMQMSKERQMQTNINGEAISKAESAVELICDAVATHAEDRAKLQKFAAEVQRTLWFAEPEKQKATPMSR